MTALEPHFFRRESGRMIATLVRVLGVHHYALAEDVVQDTLCRALEVWKFSGPPANPSAWLAAVARNRAFDLLRRDKTARTYAPELGRLLDSEWTLVAGADELFHQSAPRDDELRMMFSVCQPRLTEEAQIALVLHSLCGFSVAEIAAAFFASAAAIEKRLTRAKAALAESRTLFELTDANLGARLGTVNAAIYLLFNEGYHGASATVAVREQLCAEALRLVMLLVEHPRTSTPATHALAALLCLHAARLPARVSPEGELRSLFEQDRGAWDRNLVARGLELLDLSASGDELTEYHLEAAIASHHARAARRDDTAWREIVALYDLLAQMRPSPVVRLSRAIAIAELEGPVRGLAELEAIDGRELLARYPFYEAALGEMRLRTQQHALAHRHFTAAGLLARSPMERRFFEQRARACE